MGGSIKVYAALLVVVFSSLVMATDKIDYISTYNPEIFAELLDCEIRENTLFIAGVSGFTIVDISDIQRPRHIGRYIPQGHPYNRYYHITIDDDIAYGFAREDGLAVINFSIPESPELIQLLATNRVEYEDGVIYGDILYAATHFRGIEIFDILSDGRLSSNGRVSDQLENAIALKVKDQFLYVADGAGGIKVFDVSDRFEPQFVSEISTTSAAQDIDFYGDIAAVAVGGDGVDIIDFSNPANPEWLSNYEGEGSAFNLSVESNLVYVARWERVEVIDISIPSSPSLVGWEDTRTRAMGLTVSDSKIFVADWLFVEIFEFGQGNQQDIHIGFENFQIGEVEPGNQIDTSFTIYNTGGSDLIIDEITSTNNEFIVSPTSSVIPADGELELGISYTAPDDQYSYTILLIDTNDPDEWQAVVQVRANGSDYLAIGDLAPDFTLLDVNTFSYRLSDYRGRVVLLAWFASW